MVVFSVPKKRKLSKAEANEVKAFKVAIKYLTKDHAKQSCEDYNPNCPACMYHILCGMMMNHIANIEY